MTSKTDEPRETGTPEASTGSADDATRPGDDPTDGGDDATADDAPDTSMPDEADVAARGAADAAASASDEAADAAADDAAGALAELQRAHDEAREDKLRLLAEFQNFRRRAERQQADARQGGMAELVGALLTPLHNLERAIEHARSEDAAAGVVEGLDLVLQGFRGALTQKGIEALDPDGAPFDAEQMEAMGQVPHADVPEGHVVQVIQKGLRIGDRLIEPARVLVSMGTPPDPGDADAKDEG